MERILTSILLIHTNERELTDRHSGWDCNIFGEHGFSLLVMFEIMEFLELLPFERRIPRNARYIAM